MSVMRGPMVSRAERNDMQQTLLQRKHFRVHTISKIDIAGLDPGMPRITDKAFVDMPISYGLGIEAKCGRHEGQDIYQVVAFVHWDAGRDEPKYDVLLDRVANEWLSYPEFGAEFKECVDFAVKAVESAVDENADGAYE